MPTDGLRTWRVSVTPQHATHMQLRPGSMDKLMGHVWDLRDQVWPAGVNPAVGASGHVSMDFPGHYLLPYQLQTRGYSLPGAGHETHICAAMLPPRPLGRVLPASPLIQGPYLFCMCGCFACMCIYAPCMNMVSIQARREYWTP